MDKTVDDTWDGAKLMMANPANLLNDLKVNFKG